MYCVKCGVRLQDGTPNCPLCDTPVWNPGGNSEPEKYPDTYPERYSRRRQAIALLITILCAIACGTLLLICNRIYGETAWGGIVVFGILLAYIAFVLPSWFRKPNPVIFIPVTHAAVLGYLCYLCNKINGNWFWSFAMPITTISMILSSAFAALMKYVKGGRYYIFGGLFFLSAGSSMLIEYFEHITFGDPMFVWSIYSAGALSIIAIVLILAGIIKPMGDYFNRLFFF